MDIESCSSTTSEKLIMYQAIKDNKLEDVKSLLDSGMGINTPLWTTGSYAGYTALHVACTENKDELVELLINDYKADVNAVAEDETQPIHLACFYEPYISKPLTNTVKLRSLLKANANADADFGREVFTKHVKDQKWRSDFGDSRMTLFTYTIFYEKPDLGDVLVNFVTNLKTKSITNKTYLMYALENNFSSIADGILKVINDPAYMNHQDNDGIPTSHYILLPKKYGQFRYNSDEQIGAPLNKQTTMQMMMKAGIDKYALINGDPATFLPNMAAYRSSPYLLRSLLSDYLSMPLGRVLYYATLPVGENLTEIMQLQPDENPDDCFWFMDELQEMRQECIKWALIDLINRRTFGLPVNKQEIQLMESKIATDIDIKNIVNNYKKNFIQEELYKKLIVINGKQMSFLDFLKQVFDNKKLKLLVKDKTILDWYCQIGNKENFLEEYLFFAPLVNYKIKDACEKLELLNNLKKISTLRKSIDLPYEIILEIIEYLNNVQLQIFINAFIS